jgi:hypothetical protein
VSKGAVENVLRGATPQGDTLDRLEVWAKTLGFNVDVETGGEPQSEEQIFEDFLLSFEGALRGLERSIPNISDVERRERIRVAIDGQIQSLNALGRTVPGRLYELRGLAEGGQL